MTTYVFRFFSLVLCAAAISCASNTDNQEGNDPLTEQQQELQPTELEFDITYLTGHFDPAGHADFIEIDSVYADRSGMYMRKDAYTSFIEMHDSAAVNGIDLVIRSAARNFEYQKGIWERKWTGETKIENGKDASVAYPDPKDRALAILRFSSMPGTSRHHWGTDIDLNSFENSWFESGEGKRVYDFLVSSAAHFGFCQPYTAKSEERPNGYEEERWHWSYMPVSLGLTELAETSLEDNAISGFLGAEVAGDIRVVDNYVLGINPDCR